MCEQSPLRHETESGLIIKSLFFFLLAAGHIAVIHRDDRHIIFPKHIKAVRDLVEQSAVGIAEAEGNADVEQDIGMCLSPDHTEIVHGDFR